MYLCVKGSDARQINNDDQDHQSLWLHGQYFFNPVEVIDI